MRSVGDTLADTGVGLLSECSARSGAYVRLTFPPKLGRHLFDDYWSPKIVASVNDYDVKLVKARGEFVWHQHDATDEVFLVTAGQLRIQLQDGDDVVLSPGELFVVPRGVRHRPVAGHETHLVLLEPYATVNTGDAELAGTVGERVS
jgi:mannose-6-phosphate isomerase-like protein (cupin superfamily)